MTESKGDLSQELLELLSSLLKSEPQYTPTSLPLPRSPSAPRFGGDGGDLEFFLEELDLLFDKHKVPDLDRPKRATRYMDPATRAMWKNLDEYNGPWDEFKEAAFTLYPSPGVGCGASLAELDKLCAAFVAVGYPTHAQFFEFYRDFSTLSKVLVRNDYLSKRDESSMFLKALEPQLREETKFQLRLTNPRRPPYAPIPISDIYAAATYSIEGKGDPFLDHDVPITSSYQRASQWFGNKTKVVQV